MLVVSIYKSLWTFVFKWFLDETTWCHALFVFVSVQDPWVCPASSGHVEGREAQEMSQKSGWQLSFWDAARALRNHGEPAFCPGTGSTGILQDGQTFDFRKHLWKWKEEFFHKRGVFSVTSDVFVLPKRCQARAGVPLVLLLCIPSLAMEVQPRPWEKTSLTEKEIN